MQDQELLKIFDKVLKIYSYKDIENFIESFINTLLYASEERDPYTAGHQRRVAQLCYEISIKMGLSEEVIKDLYLSALVHDIGKIKVPAEILMNPHELRSVERALIEEHVSVGYSILKRIKYFENIPEIVYQHHERLDGSGYPRGLCSSEIRIESKIIMVADVVEAMTNIRPYRAALGLDKALKEIDNNKNTLYDKKVVEVCINLFKEGFNFSTTSTQ